MHYSNMDAYFHMASHGDQNAYEFLYKEFLSRAESVVQLSGLKLPKNTDISVDFNDFLDYMFFKILNEYDEQKGGFGHFCDYCLHVRLIPKIHHFIAQRREDISKYNFEEMESINAEFPSIEDANASMRKAIQLSQFKLKIGSPNASRNKTDRVKRKVALMLYAGFKCNEIKTKLHLTESKYRTILEKLKRDEDLNNLKLEMK